MKVRNKVKNIKALLYNNLIKEKEKKKKKIF